MGSRPPLLLLAVLTACADGGKEERPQSEVRFTNTNHLFAFRTLRWSRREHRRVMKQHAMQQIFQ